MWGFLEHALLIDTYIVFAKFSPQTKPVFHTHLKLCCEYAHAHLGQKKIDYKSIKKLVILNLLAFGGFAQDLSIIKSTFLPETKGVPYGAKFSVKTQNQVKIK